MTLSLFFLLVGLVATACALLSEAGYLTAQKLPGGMGWNVQLTDKAILYGIRVQWEVYYIPSRSRRRGTIQNHPAFLDWPRTLRIAFRALSVMVYTGPRRA